MPLTTDTPDIINGCNNSDNSNIGNIDNGDHASKPGNASTGGGDQRHRVILDTNVCLDLFVFRDPRWAGLLQALQDGRIAAFTREDCRMEWLIVLDYPHLPLKEEDKPAIRAEFDRLLTCLPNAAVNTFGLPVCSDPDDQKFLELALQADAAVLITKDKALLKLARKTARKNMFAIMTPQLWHATPEFSGAATS